MEQQYFTFTATLILLIVGGLIGIIKSLDWLISLKYKTKDDCSATRHAWEKQLREEFAKKEAVQNVKEDVDDIRAKVSDIHKIILEWAMKDGDK